MTLRNLRRKIRKRENALLKGYDERNFNDGKRAILSRARSDNSGKIRRPQDGRNTIWGDPLETARADF